MRPRRVPWPAAAADGRPLERLQHELTAIHDDQLLVLGGPSASGVERAIGDAV